jgi:hypothetical protein
MNAPLGADSPARRLRDAIEPVAAHAFWSPRTAAAVQGLGLTAMSVYVCGRAAVLGATTPDVVVATFAWFDPDLIATAYAAGTAQADWQSINAARNGATAESLRAALPQDPGAEADILADAVAAANESGRALFGARRGQGRPSDPHERLWWACESLRDHRGDSHVAAALAADVGPVEMNILTELRLGGELRVFTRTRGWSEAAMDRAIAALTDRGWLQDGALTDAGRQARDDIEAATDRQDRLVLDSIGGALPQLCATLNAWGDQCIAANAFPDNPFKRAAG